MPRPKLLLLLLLRTADAWISISAQRYGATLQSFKELQSGNFSGTYLQTIGWLWHAPLLSLDSRGLGGSITWAWDDALCAKLEPRFPEDLFFAPLVGCTDLKAAMHRAFDSWAANHRLISFTDVTEECRKMHGAVNKETCGAHAEIWVTSRELDAAGSSSEVAALATQIPKVVDDFRFTSGHRPGTSIVETVGGTISFTTDRTDGGGICWYLDSAFCTNFHALKQISSPGHVRAAGLVLVLTVTFAAALVTCMQLIIAVRALAKTTEVGRRCPALLGELATWSLCRTAIRFVLIVTPWLFYLFIFIPCWDCYDFEAAATHEVLFLPAHA